MGGVIQYTHYYLPGGMEYRKTGTGNTRIEAIYHAEGRYANIDVDVDDTPTWQKEYTLKDHLGNARVTFTDKNNNGMVDVPTDIVQENHYYPFGYNYEGNWRMNDAGRDLKYQYNGKELNDDFGLNWNDYGARFYDAAIGRWGQVDPMAEKYYGWSPYNYVFNNPLKFIDPDGMDPDDPPTKQTIHSITLQTSVNPMTGYVGKFSLQETRTTITTELSKTSDGRAAFNITTESTQITREYVVNTSGMEGEVILSNESKSSTIVEEQYLALGTNKGFISPKQENVVDYEGGPLKQQTTERDASSVKASPLFDQLSGREQGLVKSGDATAFKDMKQASNLGRASTYAGGVGLIPSGATQVVGGIATVVGVINQIRADNQKPNQNIRLYYDKKSEK